MSYHDLRHFRDGDGRDAATFDAWLGEAACLAPARRDEALRGWADAPAGRACHPREEHLLPLMVAAGRGRRRTSACAPSTTSSAARRSPASASAELR